MSRFLGPARCCNISGGGLLYLNMLTPMGQTNVWVFADKLLNQMHATESYGSCKRLILLWKIMRHWHDTDTRTHAHTHTGTYKPCAARTLTHTHTHTHTHAHTRTPARTSHARHALHTPARTSHARHMVTYVAKIYAKSIAGELRRSSERQCVMLQAPCDTKNYTAALQRCKTSYL